MEVAIRVDASLEIGTGHVYRCLSLAKALRENKHTVVFFCRALSGNLIDFISDQEFKVITLPQASCASLPPSSRLSNDDELTPYIQWLGLDYSLEIEQSAQAIKSYLLTIECESFDWIISDHYALDAHWHKPMREFSKHILHIDDLANRPIDCDIVLDQNYYVNMDDRYHHLCPRECQQLLGPQFALLNAHFFNLHRTLTPFSERLAHGQVLFFFGGIDKGNETLKALKGIAPLLSKYKLKGLVVLGQNNPNQHSVIEYCEAYLSLSVAIQIDNMALRLAESFLYVGAVGATVWERCCLGLPAITTTVAANQEALAKSLTVVEAHYCLGQQQDSSAAKYAEMFKTLCDNKSMLTSQADKVFQLVDAKGCSRVVAALEQINRK